MVPSSNWPGNQTLNLEIGVRTSVESPLYCLIAQLVERLTVNQDVAGSSPAGAARAVSEQM